MTFNDPLAEYCQRRAAERAANPAKYQLHPWDEHMAEEYRQGAIRNGYGY